MYKEQDVVTCGCDRPLCRVAISRFEGQGCPSDRPPPLNLLYGLLRLQHALMQVDVFALSINRVQSGVRLQLSPSRGWY